MNRAFSSRATCRPLLAAAFVLLGVLAPSGAEADATRHEIEDLYLQSLDDYDNLRLEAAKTSLRTAIRLASKADIRDTLAAQLHLHLGLVLFVETKDAFVAEEQFVKALEIDPSIRLDPMNATPTIEDAFQEARARARAPEGGGPGRVRGRDSRARTSKVRHEPVLRAYAGVNVPIYVEVPSDLPVYRALLSYRTGPSGAFSEVELEPSGTRGFSGYIPAEAVVGDLVEYYITVTDRRGDELGVIGGPLDPFPVSLQLGGGGARNDIPELTFDDDVDFGAGAPRRRSEGDGDTGHLALGPGAGVGWITGGPLREFTDTEVDAGLADTAFHLYAELGFYAAEDFMLLATGRFQFLVSDKQTRVVPMPALRARYWYDNEAPVRQFVGVIGGYCGFNPERGCVENRVNLADQNYVDTAPKGPVAAGLESGLTFGSGPVRLLVSLSAYALFPEKTSFQFDPNLAMVIAF